MTEGRCVHVCVCVWVSVIRDNEHVLVHVCVFVNEYRGAIVLNLS